MFYTKIILQGKCYDTDTIFSQFPLINSKKFTIANLTILCENIIKNKSIKYVFIEYDTTFSCMMGQLEQIYNLLKRMTVHGKKTIFFSSDYNEKALYLSGACSKRIMPECGRLAFLGFKRQFSYLKNLLEKLNIEANVIRRGKFKGAADIFRLDKIDEAQKTAHSRILEVFDETAKKTICSSFNFSQEFFNENIEGKIIWAQEAKKLGIIDEISHLQQYINKKEKEEKIHKYTFKKLKSRFGKGRKVAVLYFDGGIKDGENDANSPLGEEIGDRYMIKQIEKIRKNKRIKSLIFKVNSPGGSATASDAIANALLELKKEKDLIVVQSGVAGSGGYYISFPAEKIFTQNTTITGSIGVISVFFNMKDFYERFGITHSTLKTHEYADIETTTRKKTEEELKLLDSLIENIYNGFLSNVAKNRNKTVEQIDEVAQGRIWAGIDAIKIGLADEIGDLHSALDYLKEKHKTKNLSVEFYPKRKVSFISKLISPKEDLSFERSIINLLNIENYIKRNNYKILAMYPEIFLTDFYI